ncbi:MAG: WYL domain-containing protein [Rhodoferax sp.]
MPLGLAQQGPRLYLVCRFDGYDNERSLALHRIRSAQVSTLAFDRPPHFDLEKYDDDGRFGFGEGHQIRLRFWIDTEAGFHLYETPLSKDQQIRDVHEDWMEVTATVVDSAMLDWWLRGFAENIMNIEKQK